MARSTAADLDRDAAMAKAVFVALIVLTILSVSTVTLAQDAGRTMLITWALSLAAVKATLIGLYFMHLLGEKPLTWGLVAAAIAAVLALFIGILPDTALRMGQ